MITQSLSTSARIRSKRRLFFAKMLSSPHPGTSMPLCKVNLLINLQYENSYHFKIFVRWLNGKAPIDNTLTQPWDAYLLDLMLLADHYVVPSLASFCWKKFMILFRPISFVSEAYRPSLAFLEILDQSIICELGECLKEHITMHHIVFLVEDTEKDIDLNEDLEETTRILTILNKWKRAAGDELEKPRLEKASELRRQRNDLLQSLEERSKSWDLFCIDHKIRCTYPAVSLEDIKKKSLNAMPMEEKRLRDWNEGDLKLAIQSDQSWLHDDPKKAEVWAAELVKPETDAVRMYAKYKNDDELEKRFRRVPYFSYNGIRIGTLLIPRT
jgi:hypothetical protein